MDAEPAQRLGLPGTGLPADPRQARQLGVLVRAAGRAACGRRGSRWRRRRRRSRPPRPGPPPRSTPTDGHQSRVTPSTPAQPSVDPHVARPANSRTEALAQLARPSRPPPPRPVRARAVAVRDAAAADGDPAVRGALQVAVGVRAVEHRLARPPSRSRPTASRQRLGDDHRAVHRDQGRGAARPGRPCSPRWPGRPSGADTSPRGVTASRGRSAVTGVSSKIVTPAASHAPPARGRAWPGARARSAA